jgi:hypothetical protein
MTRSSVSDFDQVAARDLYYRLMREIRERGEQIRRAVSGESGLDGHYAREFGYLQLRMICETIALGCLVAHGDIAKTKTRKVQSEWKPESILKHLERLHPNFYPHPHTMQRLGPGRFHMDWLRTGFLTKLELAALWNKCGRILHRGTGKSLKSSDVPEGFSFHDIHEWMEKVATLLGVHRVALIDGKTNFVCTISKNEVQVAIAKAVPFPDSAPTAA